MTATILLVEDDQTARSFMAPLLRDAGYEVREAETLEAAHRTLDRSEADIMILGLQLRGGDGPERRARVTRAQPGLPVIVGTGFGDIELAVEVMKVGALDFIQKPVDMIRLRQAVDKAMESIALRRELAL